MPERTLTVTANEQFEKAIEHLAYVSHATRQGHTQNAMGIMIECLRCLTKVIAIQQIQIEQLQQHID